MTDDTPQEFEDLTYLDQVAIAQRLRGLADYIENELREATGKRVGFSLLTWGNGRSQYVSNCQRHTIKEGMRELLDRWDVPGEDLGVPTKTNRQ